MPSPSSIRTPCVGLSRFLSVFKFVTHVKQKHQETEEEMCIAFPASSQDGCCVEGGMQAALTLSFIRARPPAHRLSVYSFIVLGPCLLEHVSCLPLTATQAITADHLWPRCSATEYQEGVHKSFLSSPCFTPFPHFSFSQAGAHIYDIERRGDRRGKEKGREGSSDCTPSTPIPSSPSSPNLHPLLHISLY
ncbi:hypothetical protein CCH79_00003320 [Gambusia affinis]|uniref:Uncharacterized protein n=1 Tax=Gambusia affinis TaxID=33528 RepID=A0A315VF03_GAMAF|nr:hypothetical protein CCH79_00003320 [Gambusia affinis]